MPRRGRIPRVSEPPITLEEAKRRGLWAIHRVRRGRYTCAPAGEPCPGVFCGWAADKPSAMNACAARGREELHPDGGRHQTDQDPPPRSKWARRGPR